MVSRFISLITKEPQPSVMVSHSESLLNYRLVYQEARSLTQFENTIRPVSHCMFCVHTDGVSAQSCGSVQKIQLFMDRYIEYFF